MSDSVESTHDTRPTRVRYKVVTFAILLAMVTYLDRACLGTMSGAIREDLQLTKTQMGFVYSAFAWAYAIFEIPTALWADRIGTRRVLTRIVVWWSCFTIATSRVIGLWSLVSIRFLFGMGEAGAWPAVAKTFSIWIPRHQRGTIQGIFFAGAHLAAGVTPTMTIALMPFLGWRGVLALFGSLGLVWAVMWRVFYRDDPSEHPGVNAAELNMIQSGRELGGGHHGSWEAWKRTIFNRNVLALSLMYFPNSMGFYFCISWLPTYLEDEHGFSGLWLGIYAGLPLVLSVLADLFGGATTDWAVRRFGLRLGRAGVGFFSYLIAGVVLLLSTRVSDPGLAATMLAIATASSMFLLGAAWGTCIEIGGNHAGVVGATMNTSGQIASAISPVIIGYIVEQMHDWKLPLYMIGSMFLFGALCWCFIDPRRKVFE